MPAAPVSAASFEEHLAREIIHSERVRMALLAALIGALLVMQVVLLLLFRDDYRRYFTSASGIPRTFTVLVLLMVYELTIRHVVGRRAAAGRGIPGTLRYLNAFVEVSVPSILIVLLAREINPVIVLQGAVVLLYGVFIVLSTLRLDFRLSAFTGAVASIEYVGLSIAYTGAGGAAFADTPFEAPPFYFAKGAMLLLAGFAAGFVALQLKRRVGNAFRTMQERQRVLDAFGQQVSPAIAEELLRSETGIASRRASVCIMFMDIRNFTRLVGNWPPERIVALQNAVFSEAVAVVNRHQGIINQFLGDGFMATFGAPTSTGRDSANALAAARDMVAAVSALAAAGRIPPITVGIGLHAGEAVTGNIGSAQRQQYSITGDVVILASRIEQLNKEYGSQILVSREVLDGAGEAPPPGAALGPVTVKGREQPIELFRLA